MDFIFHQFEVSSSKIYLLEFTDDFNPNEYLDSLTSIEQERFFEFKSDKRKKEFVATRILKHQLFSFQEIKYEAHGAPYFDDDNYISISHAPNLVGIACNSSYQIGFDIELIKPKITTIYHKFVTELEETFIDVKNIIELTATWSLKETLYKLAGRNLLDFKKELILLEKNKTDLKGKIVNHSEEIFVDLHYFQFKNYVISINSNEIEYVSK